MVIDRQHSARLQDLDSPVDPAGLGVLAPRRRGSPLVILAASFLVVLGGVLPAVGLAASGSGWEDADANGVEDALDSWLAGATSWQDLRGQSRHSRALADPLAKSGSDPLEGKAAPAGGSWSDGRIRILALGNSSRCLEEGRAAALAVGECALIHDLDVFGGVQVLTLDEAGLGAFLGREFDGSIVLDRDGLPALATSRGQVGADQLATSQWSLGNDWSSTLAILDSGCDTAHGDLGDFGDDNQDGPPPAVGDANDWYPADSGWPLFLGYRVMGWHDVTNDFPEAQGPWDYHYHGTALASVAAGSGVVNPDFHGINPGGRLTVVKFYDFDGVWHAWAGDFLAACAWVLENRETYRIRSVLAAVNWDADLGIAQAMSELVDAGIVPVAAMGNYGDDPSGPGYPATLRDVLSVGSVDAQGAVSVFSGRGRVNQSKPDLLAPGDMVTVADNEPDDTYSPRQGTSLGAAHVAGALYMLEEALVDNGLHLPADRVSVNTRKAVLRATAARTDLAADGQGGTITLPAHNAPDHNRGWGLLRVDAAVKAMLHPLLPGQSQEDTLSADFQRPVTARRLVLSPGVRYLIEVVPQPGLDVELEIVDPRDMDSDPFAPDLLRANANGSGVSEFLYYHAPLESWSFLVARQVSGSGRVTLRVNEADAFSEPSAVVALPGNMTGAANVGRLPSAAGPTIVIPSRVEVDHIARSVNVMDGAGVSLPGWPVFVFPQGSAVGGLRQPVVWDLDDQPGDEIVLSSEFGSVYFFNWLGAWIRVQIGFNVPLTTAVGVQEAGGQRRVVAVDAGGVLRSWSWGPILEVERDLGFDLPLDPAVGQLVAGAPEELAIAFASGTVLVTDTAGEPLAGWPVDLGVPLESPPVLCDLDDDGLHEIIIPHRDTATGTLRFHVLQGDGQPGPGNGQLVVPPSGGQWLQVSPAMVAGRYGTGDLRVSVSGLMDNGQTGPGARWNFGLASLTATGAAQGRILAGFEVAATTDQGVLTLERALLPPLLGWDVLGGTGTEETAMLCIDWTELLYGLTAIHGSSAGWYRPILVNRPLEERIPLRPGGSQGLNLVSGGEVLVDLDSDIFLKFQILDDEVSILPVLDGQGLASNWPSARADQRNSGAYPLETVVSAVPAGPVGRASLSVFPNPGSGRFRFRLGDETATEPIQVGIYDLRGRHVRSLVLRPEDGAGSWDGCDGRGRQVAAGTYFAVARQGGRKSTARFVVTR